MKASEHISGFLNFLRQAEKDYSYYCDVQSEMDKDTTDILHTFELDYTLSDSDYAKLGRACAGVRRRRRSAKDHIEVLSSIVEYISGHAEQLRQLEKLLGEVRKTEKRQENRVYIPRGSIVQDTLADRSIYEEETNGRNNN